MSKPSDGPPLRILHVDDDRMFLDLASTLLDRMDAAFEVRSVERAEEALELLAEEPVDCVVSDYDMPGMDGIELLEAVRDVEPELPFVLFTGRGSEDVASRAISVGVTDYMQKGTGRDTFDLLAKRVRNHVAARRTERSLSEVRARYRRMLRTSPAPVVLFDGEGAIDYANPAAAEAVGAEDPSELLGRSVAEFVHPDAREAVAERMRTVLDDRAPVPALRMRFVDVDGDDFEAIIATAPVVYDGKDGGQAVLTDVRTVQEPDLALLAGRSSTEHVVESAGDVRYHLEMGGEVVPVTLEPEGVADGGVPEEAVEDLLDDEDGAARTLETAIEEGLVRLHASLVSTSGERIPLALREGRLVGPSGDPVAALGFDAERVDDDEA